MAQLTIQNNGRQPFTFFVLRTEPQNSEATILEKIFLHQGDQVHCKIADTSGHDFTVAVGKDGEKGATASTNLFPNKTKLDLVKHDRWTVIYSGDQWSVF